MITSRWPLFALLVVVLAAGSIDHTAVAKQTVSAAAGKLAPADSGLVSAPARNGWPKPCLLIPELPEAPVIDGQAEDVWAKAAPGAIAYPPASDKPIRPDTTMRIGHRAGVLYLLLTYDWPGATPPQTNASGHDGAVSRDDGGEIFFSAPDRPSTTQQLIFNLAGVQADNTILLNGQDIGYQSSWDPQWQVATKRIEKAWNVEIAIPLAQLPGMGTGIGDIFLFDIVRNRWNDNNALMHWSPVGGSLNGRPADFGFAVLTGPQPAHFRWHDIKPQYLNRLIGLDKYQTGTALAGYPITLNLLNPVGGQVNDTPANLRATLRDASGKIVRVGRIESKTWPRTLTIQPPRVATGAQQATGAYRLELETLEGRRLFTTPLHWQTAVTIRAEDASAVKVSGQHGIDVYPRGVNRNSLFLFTGAKATLTGDGRAIYLNLPPGFGHPGAYYANTLPAVLRYRIDGKAWQSRSLAELANQVPLAENLANGRHRIEIEATQWRFPVQSFTFAIHPLAGVRGYLTSSMYTELLTDVRLDTFSGTRLVRTDYVRNPANGKFALFGLPPGTYRFRFSASGWQPYETKPVTLKAGQKVDLGSLSLRMTPALEGYTDSGLVRYRYGLGKTINAAPGETFRIGVPFEKAQLVSRYKTIDLEKVDFQRGDFSIPAQAIYKIPEKTPHDMYSLRFFYTWDGHEYPLDLPQSVCVREPLPAEFHIAGMSHLNTWGQETSEYLQRVAEVAQLAGARFFFDANDVNAAYIAGALKDLRIPCLATAGNHTMARWDDFFGPRSYAIDDGPLRIVTFNDEPYQSWTEAARLAGERPDATNRVLLAFEAYAPLDVILKGKLGLLFDGHSVEEHPQHDKFLPGTIHIRAPDYQAIRWIAMTPQGLSSAYQRPRDIPSFRIPREGVSPLRAVFASPNDGTKEQNAARIVNKLKLSFPHARLRFVIKAGASECAVQGGKLLQSFVSDDKKLRILDIETNVPANSEVRVDVMAKR